MPSVHAMALSCFSEAHMGLLVGHHADTIVMCACYAALRTDGLEYSFREIVQSYRQTPYVSTYYDGRGHPMVLLTRVGQHAEAAWRHIHTAQGSFDIVHFYNYIFLHQWQEGMSHCVCYCRCFCLYIQLPISCHVPVLANPERNLVPDRVATTELRQRRKQGKYHNVTIRTKAPYVLLCLFDDCECGRADRLHACRRRMELGSRLEMRIVAQIDEPRRENVTHMLNDSMFGIMTVRRPSLCPSFCADVIARAAATRPCRRTEHVPHV